MKRIICLIFIFLCSCTVKQNPAPQNPGTPNKASDKARILATVQQEVKNRYHNDVTLTAQYLKVNQKWAYVETTGGGDPSVNAVLKKVKGQWVLAKPAVGCNPVCPAGMSTCADGELVCKNSLHQQFPAAPKVIFPTPNAKRMVINQK